MQSISCIVSSTWMRREEVRHESPGETITVLGIMSRCQFQEERLSFPRSCVSHETNLTLCWRKETKKDFLQEMRDEALKREVLSLLKEVFFFSLGSRDSRSFFLLLLRHHLLLSFKPCVARHPQKTENALLIIPNYGLKYSPALITAFFSFFSLHRLLAVQAGKRRQRMRWNKNISNKQEREEVREREKWSGLQKKEKESSWCSSLSHPSLSLFSFCCVFFPLLFYFWCSFFF